MLTLSKGTKDAKKKGHEFGLKEFYLVPWRNSLRSWYIFRIIPSYIMLSSVCDVRDSFFIHTSW